MSTMARRLGSIGLLWLLALAPPALAQTPAGSRWEIEGHGGIGFPSLHSAGETTLPLPGPSLTTSSPIFPTRQVPSWFFGDGATLVNGVNGEFGVASRIAPLDAVLGADGLGGGSAAAFGARLRRRMTPHVSLEVSVDVLPTSSEVDEAVQQAVEASRASFEPVFRGLLATGPFTVAAVQATSATASSSGRDLAVTGALDYAWTPLGAFVPYVTFGGGLLASSGGSSATLTGTYRFSILNQVPVEEIDRLTIRYERDTTWTAVVGGGARRAMSDRWGLSFDVRAWIGPGTGEVLIDAAPSVTRGTPAGFVESFTSPAIQFSNDPATGRQSTLSAGLDGFEAFSGGVQTRVLLTVGIYRRF